MKPHLEIERKFLVNKPPTGWTRNPSIEIVQGCLPTAAKSFEIRLRRQGSKYYLTIKKGHGLRRLDAEIEISKKRFCSLWPFTRAARISKRRYRIQDQSRTIEMDIYRGPDRGLITAEIEFDSLRASLSFQPLKWMDREITGCRDFANANLARKRRLPNRKLA